LKKKKRKDLNHYGEYTGVATLTRTWEAHGRVVGTSVETHYTSFGTVLFDGEEGARPRPIRIRIIRTNQFKNVRKALPGARIRFKGRLNSDFAELELHVTECSILRSATLIDGYQPVHRTDGTWRWVSLEKAYVSTTKLHPESVDGTEIHAIWR